MYAHSYQIYSIYSKYSRKNALACSQQNRLHRGKGESWMQPFQLETNPEHLKALLILWHTEMNRRNSTCYRSTSEAIYWWISKLIMVRMDHKAVYVHRRRRQASLHWTDIVFFPNEKESQQLLHLSYHF